MICMDKRMDEFTKFIALTDSEYNYLIDIFKQVDMLLPQSASKYYEFLEFWRKIEKRAATGQNENAADDKHDAFKQS